MMMIIIILTAGDIWKGEDSLEITEMHEDEDEVVCRDFSQYCLWLDADRTFYPTILHQQWSTRGEGMLSPREGSTGMEE